MAQKICRQCGALFTARLKTQKFCSQTCTSESQRKPPAPCAVCGKEFWAQGTAHKTCSDECLHALRMQPKQKDCLNCVAMFMSHAAPAKFCSVECRTAHTKLRTRLKRANYTENAVKQPRYAKPVARGKSDRPCDECGVVYAPSHTYQQFCSVGCKNKAHSKRMKGDANPNYQHGLEVDYYSKEFRKTLNKQVRSKYGECFQCGGKTNLCAHHMDEVKTNNATENLACLCRSCHIRWHKSGNAELRESMTSLWRKTIASWPVDS